MLRESLQLSNSHGQLKTDCRWKLIDFSKIVLSGLPGRCRGRSLLHVPRGTVAQAGVQLDTAHYSARFSEGENLDWDFMRETESSLGALLKDSLFQSVLDDVPLSRRLRDYIAKVNKEFEKHESLKQTEFQEILRKAVTRKDNLRKKTYVGCRGIESSHNNSTSASIESIHEMKCLRKKHTHRSECSIAQNRQSTKQAGLSLCPMDNLPSDDRWLSHQIQGRQHGPSIQRNSQDPRLCSAFLLVQTLR